MPSHSVLQCCLSSAWGGLEMVALENAQRLRAKGVDVTTACRPGSPLAQELAKHQLPVLQINRKHKYFAWGAIRRLRQELGTGNYGAVLVHQLNDLWQVVPALIGFKNVRLIGVAHTFVGIRKKDWLHRWLYRRLDALIALTSLHKENLTTHLPVPRERVPILPNAVDAQRFQPARRSEEFRRKFGGKGLLIGVVSRLDENKGLREAVAAAAQLRDDGAEFTLAIVGKETAGEGGMQRALEEEIARYRLQDRVFLAGHHSDIEKVIASFDILLMPSPAETFGRVLIEAMSCGVPVVASAGGGVPDIIRNEVNGLLVPPLEAGAMAAALQRYLASPELRAQMARQGQADVESKYETRVVERRLFELLGVAD